MSDSDSIVREDVSESRNDESFNQRDNFGNTGRMGGAMSTGGFSQAQATGRSNVSRNSGMPPHRAQKAI